MIREVGFNAQADGNLGFNAQVSHIGDGLIRLPDPLIPIDIEMT